MASTNRSEDYRGTLAIAIAVALQWIVFLIVRFGDIGFDHRGRYGLDFEHFILLSVGYLIVCLFALGIALASGRIGVVLTVLLGSVFHVFVVLYPVGDDKGETVMVFRNNSTVDVRIESISGFSNYVDGGKLSGGAIKTLRFGKMSIPPRTTITWSRDNQSAEPVQVTELLLSPRKPSAAGDALLIEYDDDAGWRASFVAVRE